MMATKELRVLREVQVTLVLKEPKEIRELMVTKEPKVLLEILVTKVLKEPKETRVTQEILVHRE